MTSVILPFFAWVYFGTAAFFLLLIGITVWLDMRKAKKSGTYYPTADEIMKDMIPKDWPKDAPPYWSEAGWRFEKEREAKRLRDEFKSTKK